MKPFIVPGKLPTPPMTGRLAYSIAETARLLGCSERSIQTWIKAGKIPRKKVGSRVFIPATELEALLAVGLTNELE